MKTIITNTPRYGEAHYERLGRYKPHFRLTTNGTVFRWGGKAMGWKFHCQIIDGKIDWSRKSHNENLHK
jgi:hypothetical protein